MQADMSGFQFHALIPQNAASIAHTGRGDVFARLGFTVTAVKVQPNSVADWLRVVVWDGWSVIDLSSNHDRGQRIGDDFRAPDITHKGDRPWLG
jgi:hypothetical protein